MTKTMSTFNPVAYHGPSGDVNDPAVMAAVMTLRARYTPAAPIVALYTDGGVIGQNPSLVGGTWAWCLVDASGEMRRHAFGRITPAVDHINAGFAGTSTDFELLLTRAWIKRLRPSRVVLYVFGYNDLAELDRSYPCCPAGPLLDTSPDLRARCQTPGQVSGRLDLFAQSPAPYPLRVATAHSALARRAVVAFAGVSDRLHRRLRGEAPGPEQRLQRFASLLRRMKRELDESHIPLSVVYLPARAALESAAPRETGDHRLRGEIGNLARELNIPFLDPWELLEGQVSRDGADRWYLPPPDIHFTREGHRLLATWLAERLAP